MLSSIVNLIEAYPYAWIMVSLLLIAVLLLLAWLRRDAADYNFSSQGLRVSKTQIGLHRQELTDLAAKLGRDVFKTDATYQLRARHMLKEHERIRQSVAESAQVIKEVGLALHTIEEEYERSKAHLQSPQAREALRQATARVISDVMASCKDGSQLTISFWLDSERQHSQNGQGEREHSQNGRGHEKAVH